MRNECRKILSLSAFGWIASSIFVPSAYAGVFGCSASLTSPKAQVLRWIGPSSLGRWQKIETVHGRNQQVVFFRANERDSMIPHLQSLQDRGRFLVMVASTLEEAQAAIRELASRHAVFVDYFDVVSDWSSASTNRLRFTLEERLMLDCAEAYRGDCDRPVRWQKSFWLGSGDRELSVRAAESMGLTLVEPSDVDEPGFNPVQTLPLRAFTKADLSNMTIQALSLLDHGPRWAKSFVYGLAHRDSEALKYGYSKLFGRLPSRADVELMARTLETIQSINVATYGTTGIVKILRGTSTRMRNLPAFGAAKDTGLYPERAFSFSVLLTLKALEVTGARGHTGYVYPQASGPAALRTFSRNPSAAGSLSADLRAWAETL